MTDEVATPGARLTRLETHPDSRGSFVEILRTASHDVSFVQSNHSFSKRGVLRGLHYHLKQLDLWYVVKGRLQVALVDLRGINDGTPQVETIELDSSAPSTLLIPPEVAHGFLALEDTHLIYWVTEEYDATDEFGISWDDPQLAVPWQIADPILSERDRNNSPYRR